jgi:hypothetical protein
MQGRSNMKETKLKSLLVVCISALLLSAQAAFGQSEALIQALIMQESDGKDSAFNRKENAVGPLQIRPAYFKDAQEHDPSLKGLKHTDCYKRDVAIRVFKAYMDRYAKGKTDEQMARIHNGGPIGHTKSSTDKYWRSVDAIMRNGGKKPK